MNQCHTTVVGEEKKNVSSKKSFFPRKNNTQSREEGARELMGSDGSETHGQSRRERTKAKGKGPQYIIEGDRKWFSRSFAKGTIGRKQGGKSVSWSR